MHKLFPTSGTFDETGWAGVLGTDTGDVYRSAADAEARLKPADKARLQDVARAAADEIDKAIDTDYNRDDPQVGLGGWANFDSQQHIEHHVYNLGPLRELTSLQVLELPRTRVADLRPLSELSGLRRLDLSRTRVSDLGPLRGLSRLASLKLNSTPVADLPVVREAESLDLSGTRIASPDDLRNAQRLRELRAIGAPVRDLRRLSLSGTGVTDLSALAGLASLRELSLDRTSISDLSPLSGLESLEELTLTDTAIDPESVAELRSRRLNLSVVGTDG